MCELSVNVDICLFVCLFLFVYPLPGEQFRVHSNKPRASPLHLAHSSQDFLLRHLLQRTNQIAAASVPLPCSVPPSVRQQGTPAASNVSISLFIHSFRLQLYKGLLTL